MIWPTEAVLLAGTKLKTRKIRLAITVIITSLLFGVLAFLASVTEGTVRSLQSFGEEGYGNKYFVQATPLTNQFGPGSDEELKDEFGPVQRDLVALKKAAAKKLGISYDEMADQTLPLQIVKNGANSTQTYPNYMSPLVLDFYAKKDAAIPGTSYDDFVKTAKGAGARNVYSGTRGGINFMNGTKTGAGQVSVIIDGKEDLTTISGFMNGPPNTSGVASITTMGWRSADNELLQPFVLPGQTLATGKDLSLPIIAPYSAAEEILGLKALPQTATAEQKLSRLVEVRTGVAGKTAQLCYRNGASSDLLTQAVQQQKEIEANKNNKDFTMPSLLYQLPAAACGEVTIKKDTRSAEEKKESANQKAFDTEFGHTEAPVQGLVTIRIIGISPDISYGFSLSPAAILTSLFTSSLGYGWVSPAKAVDANQLASTVQGGTAKLAVRSRVVYYAEFISLKQTENFIKAQTCKDLTNIQGPDGMNHAVDISGTGNTTRNCIAQQKVLTVSPYGNSAGAVETFREGIWKVASYAVLVIVIIASLIMMGNIGKIIADSRRETAVFRSLGAKRLDIAEIYLTYTVLVSMLVAVSSVIVGSIGAQLLHNHYTAQLSISAALAYNAQDVHKTFSLFGFNPLYVLAIAGLVVLAGLLAAALPLLTNTRRSPIRDMRDES